MPRTITVIVSLLIFTSVVGFIVLGLRMKLAGYPDAEFVRWYPLAVFFRSYGLWMLPIAVLWGCAAWAADQWVDDPRVYPAVVAIGVLLALFVPVSFVAAAAYPGYYPIIIYQPKSQTDS